MPGDAGPVFEYLGPLNGSRILLTCEHAGRRIPSELNGLGLAEDEIQRHIGWDIGAEGVCRELRIATGSALFLGRYSRLVVDLNRPRQSSECVIECSDGTEIPGNLGLTEFARSQRIRKYHTPFHRKLHETIDVIRPSAIIPIHTFTPILRSDGKPRPWHCAVLYSQATTLGKNCIEFLSSIQGIVVGENTPYKIEPESDYTVPIHADRQNIPSVLIEIRQDLVSDSSGQRRWAAMLAEMIAECVQRDA